MNPIVRMMKRYIKMPLKKALPLLFICSLALVATCGCTSSTTQNTSGGGSGSIGIKVNSQTTSAQMGTYPLSSTPQPGNKYVVFSITATDNNVNPATLGDPYFFKLTCADGSVYPVSGVTFMTYANGLNTIDNAKPGEHETGNVIFEIPQSQVPKTLTYSDGFNQVVTNLS